MVTVPQQPLPTTIATLPQTGPVPLYFEGTVGVSDMPSWLKQVPTGAVLQATVQGRIGQNTYSLITAQGPITISSSLALQAGTQLLFQIGPEIESQRLQLIGGTNPNPLPQPIQTTGTPVSALPLPQAAAGQTLNAIVIRPADPAPLPAPILGGNLGGVAVSAATARTAATVPAQAGAAAYAPNVVTATPSAPTSLLSAAPPNTPVPLAGLTGQTAAPSGAAASLASAPSGQIAASPSVTAPSVPGGASPAPIASARIPGVAAAAASTVSAAKAAALNDPFFPLPSSASSVFAVTQAGEQISVRLVSVTPPAPEASVAAAPVAATRFSFLREGLAALMAIGPTDANATPTSGGTTTSAPPGFQGLSGQVLTGTVIGNGAQNRPIIAVGSAILSLQAGPLQPGTQVQLIAQLNAPAATPNPLTNPAQAQPQLQGFPTYPSLPAMVAAAQQIGGQTEQALMAMLPRVGPQLAASLMVFASGAAKGDLRTLVGEQARSSLERTGRGRAALAGATREFEAAREEAGGSPAADWRAITLPVMTGSTVIEPIRLYLHQVSDEEAERNRKNEGGGQRFVLDIDLTQLGAIQIDGLAKQDRLDLVVRTPKPLSEDIRTGLRNAFLGGATARGVVGGLNFQVGPRLVLDTGQPAVRRGGVFA